MRPVQPPIVQSFQWGGIVPDERPLVSQTAIASGEVHIYSRQHTVRALTPPRPREVRSVTKQHECQEVAFGLQNWLGLPPDTVDKKSLNRKFIHTALEQMLDCLTGRADHWQEVPIEAGIENGGNSGNVVKPRDKRVIARMQRA